MANICKYISLHGTVIHPRQYFRINSMRLLHVVQFGGHRRAYPPSHFLVYPIADDCASNYPIVSKLLQSMTEILQVAHFIRAILQTWKLMSKEGLYFKSVKHIINNVQVIRRAGRGAGKD